MKTIRFTLFFGSLVSFVLLLSCQRDLQKDISMRPVFENPQALQPNVWGSPSAYIITLESRTQVNGEWVWIWSVQNSNPGSGNNGTFQNLSHWGIRFGTCVDFSTITGAAYSANALNWHHFTPVYEVDPSQSCMLDPVLKFNFGTTGSNKSYYKLVTSYNYSEGISTGFYKSGLNTGCAVIQFQGISCGSGGPGSDR